MAGGRKSKRWTGERCWLTRNKWWIEVEQQKLRERRRSETFCRHIGRKQAGEVMQAGAKKPECWGCVLPVSGEAGRGLSASDFLSYLSFSSSLTPVILLLLLLTDPAAHVAGVPKRVWHQFCFLRFFWWTVTLYKAYTSQMQWLNWLPWIIH